jgi:SPP1 gp7 family putative phage head morphogenesis protein
LAFGIEYDFNPDWGGAEEQMRLRSDQRMDVAHEMADNYADRTLAVFNSSAARIREAYRILTGTNERKAQAFLSDVRGRVLQYQADTGIELPFDEINALTKARDARRRLSGVVAAEEAICEQEFLTLLFALLYILHDNGYYQQIYDVQKTTGAAFEPPKERNADIDHLNAEADGVGKYVENVTSEYFSMLEDATDVGLATDVPISVIGWRLDEADDYLSYAVNRLIHTETTRAVADSQEAACKRIGIKKYRYLTEKDDRVCELCRPLNQKVFRFATRQAGVNFPPMHPNCRCQIMPVLDEDAREKIRELSVEERSFFRTVPLDMGYERWLREWDIAVDEILRTTE